VLWFYPHWTGFTLWPYHNPLSHTHTSSSPHDLTDWLPGRPIPQPKERRWSLKTTMMQLATSLTPSTEKHKALQMLLQILNFASGVIFTSFQYLWMKNCLLDFWKCYGVLDDHPGQLVIYLIQNDRCFNRTWVKHCKRRVGHGKREQLILSPSSPCFTPPPPIHTHTHTHARTAYAVIRRTTKPIIHNTTNVANLGEAQLLSLCEIVLTNAVTKWPQQKRQTFTFVRHLIRLLLLRCLNKLVRLVYSHS
jgi:hypothetical protein